MKQKHIGMMVQYFLDIIESEERGIYEQSFHEQDAQTCYSLSQQYKLLQEVRSGLKLVSWHNGPAATKPASTRKATRYLSDFEREVAHLFMCSREVGDKERAELLDKVWVFVTMHHSSLTKTGSTSAGLAIFREEELADANA